VDNGSFSHLVHLLPPGQVLTAAAENIVSCHVADLPDLTGVIVLLPSLHAAAPFAAALAAAAGRPALLLPQLTTLPQFAATATLPGAIVPDSLRQSMVYLALRERPWFSETDLWPLASELVQLFDELTLYGVQLPETADDFSARLAEAYRAKAGESLQFEARLVHELWYALQRDLAERLDHASAYQLQLVQLARDPKHPLYAVGLAGLAPSEVEFFRRYAQRQPVRILQGAPLDEALPGAPGLLAAAWSATQDGLRERAARLRESQPQSPLAARLNFFPAHSLEDEARAADTRVRQWLTQGRKRIAVVVQDRLSARRVRALLERAEVLVEDETGWTLSTAAASSVVMRWLDLLSNDFFHQDLLDFLKSPLVFADWPAAERKEAIYKLELIIREKGIVDRLIHYRAAAHDKEAACAPLLERLHQAQQLWPKRTQSLRAWLDTLHQTLDLLGVTPALAGDLAGAQLLQRLLQLAEELRSEQGSFRFGEWRHWLNQQMEAATFRDTSIESPVVFTHLPATRLRHFDGVVLLGCDADHLPARGSDGPFFNQSVRAQLGLRTRQETAQTELNDVAALLVTSGEVLVTWQHTVNGEEHLVSPYFELLRTLHSLTYGDTLLSKDLRELIPVAIVSHGSAAPADATAQPAPVLPHLLVPEAISASGYNSLLNCPYQYYARHVLKLNELDEVQVEMEKRDFGELVHRILLEFHRARPGLSGKDPDRMAQVLRDISATVFGPMLKLNYLSHAWALRWDKLIPAYVEWQLGRETQGWHWHAGEIAKRLTLPLPGSKALTLRGTLDRVDQSAAGLAVLDYKTRPATALRGQLKARGEDVQLPVYALLAEDEVIEACYVSLDRDDVKPVPLQEGLIELSRDVAQRLTTIFAAIHNGAAMPAQGTDDACTYCEMKGLCRRAYWISRSVNG
jgi:ATP-dependent helicase/nuclease subunit B